MKKEEVLKEEDKVEETKVEAPVKEEVTVEDVKQEEVKKEEVQEEVSADNSFDKAELEKLKAQLAEQQAILEKITVAKDNAEKALINEKANTAIEQAVSQGVLTPAQVGDGSPWVELVHNDPELFNKLMKTMNPNLLPQQQQLHNDDVISASRVERFRKLISEGKSADEAFEEVVR